MEDRYVSGDRPQLLETVMLSITHLDDESPHPASGQGNADHGSHRHLHAGGDAVEEAGIDPEGRDLGDDPSDPQSDPPARDRSAATSSVSQGSSGRPKCPYTAVCS